MFTSIYANIFNKTQHICVRNFQQAGNKREPKYDKDHCKNLIDGMPSVVTLKFPP